MAKTPAERQRQKRKREARLGMKNFTMRLAKSERECIEEMARIRGYQDQTEYLMSLVYADRERNVSQNQKESGCD